MTSGLKLGELQPGEAAVVVGFASGESSTEDQSYQQRLRELGLIQGAEVLVVNEAPYFHDPIAVRVRGSLLALRRTEANQVWVKRLSK
jgi:Fe2+ transport system protein FeoA